MPGTETPGTIILTKTKPDSGVNQPHVPNGYEGPRGITAFRRGKALCQSIVMTKYRFTAKKKHSGPVLMIFL